MMRTASRIGGTSTGRHLAAVADVFLPLEPAPLQAVDDAPLVLCAAAPGGGDTSRLLALLAALGTAGRTRDLGGDIGGRIARWEAADRTLPSLPARSALLWCPRGGEALAVRSGLLLGRLGALLRPAAVTVLWLADQTTPPGQRPAAQLCRRAARLARAAVPGVAADVRCVGWSGTVERDLQGFRIGIPDALDHPLAPRR